MNVLLGIHGRGEQYDFFIYRKVFPELSRMYAWNEVIRSDSNHEPYNRAASRNIIVDEALKRGADVVVICDADSIPEDHNLQRAIQAAYNDGKCHVPFDRVRVIAGKHADSLGQSYQAARPIHTYGPSCGGVFVIRPESWVSAGGMDERIVGWGFEDQIFLVSIRTFLGDPVYYPGSLYNFDHPRGGDHTHKPENAILRDRYNNSLGDKDAIRRLQAGSNQWRPL